MKWRNEQLYHLRQTKPLAESEQDSYFSNVVSKLFALEQPDQILFSFLRNDKCIAYGGLVHINWLDRNAEISFLMDTSLEDCFDENWTVFLKLIEEAAFMELGLHRIFTYAFDLRPNLYPILERCGYLKEAVLTGQVRFENRFIDAVIHAKTNNPLYIRRADLQDAPLTYKWANDVGIRRYSINRGTIEWHEHLEWLSNKIKDQNCIYYILVIDGVHIGSIRFDVVENKSARLSYLVDPQFQGKGFGKKLVAKGIERLKEQRPDVISICGEVHVDNLPSLKIFEDFSFRKISTEQDLSLFVREL